MDIEFVLVPDVRDDASSRRSRGRAACRRALQPPRPSAPRTTPQSPGQIGRARAALDDHVEDGTPEVLERFVAAYVHSSPRTFTVPAPPSRSAPSTGRFRCPFGHAHAARGEHGRVAAKLWKEDRGPRARGRRHGGSGTRVRRCHRARPRGGRRRPKPPRDDVNVEDVVLQRSPPAINREKLGRRGVLGERLSRRRILHRLREFRDTRPIVVDRHRRGCT